MSLLPHLSDLCEFDSIAVLAEAFEHLRLAALDKHVQRAAEERFR